MYAAFMVEPPRDSGSRTWSPAAVRQLQHSSGDACRAPTALYGGPRAWTRELELVKTHNFAYDTGCPVLAIRFTEGAVDGLSRKPGGLAHGSPYSVVQYPVPRFGPRYEIPVSTALERPIAQAVPPGQPQSVARIADCLFPAYTLDGGRVHLAGCVLEDRLIVRLRGCLESRPLELFVDGEGRDLSPELVAALAVPDAVPVERAPPLAARQMDQFLAQGLALVQQRLPTDVDFQIVSITAIWCKHAEGKLRFTFGEASADLPFAGWAQTLEPPPFVCPYSGQQGFRIAATDDGRVTLADRIVRCEETGRRTLVENLVLCAVTGRRVLAGLTAVCPVTGQQVLRRTLVACTMCGQHVSPAAIKKERCAACRSLRAVSKADPRMARLLDEHPELDRWRWWRIAETREVHILHGSRWLGQMLVVVDKGTLEIKLLATGNRLVPHWNFIDREQHEHVLRE